MAVLKLSLLPLFAIALAAQSSKPLHFDLTAIAPTVLYSNDAGFGYEKPATGNPPYYF